MSLLSRILDRLFGRPMPDDPGPETICNIATSSGWEFRITKLAGTFGAELRHPDRGFVYGLRGWRSVGDVLESTTHYLRAMGLPHIASALRAEVEAEVHS